MKRTLHYLACTLLLFAQKPPVKAQNHIVPGNFTVYSTTFTFEDNDTLSHYFPAPYIANIDTSGTHLWRIGSTSKPFFSINDSSKAIMTDTTSPYAVNANDWFTLTIRSYDLNPIVYFKHKYQTTAGHDGGIVEFSLDGGLNWENAEGDCNMDLPFSTGILTDNFYGKHDTLLTGEQAFSGTSNGWQISGLQFFMGFPVKGTSGCTPSDSILIRFRFVSDSIADSLDGWIIDDIQLRQDDYGGKVHNVAGTNQLEVCPNPVQNRIINFPALANEANLNMSLYNSLGVRVLSSIYQHQLHVDGLPAGVYYYSVSGTGKHYSGRLSIE